jgi:hypothetical protein
VYVRDDLPNLRPCARSDSWLLLSNVREVFSHGTDTYMGPPTHFCFIPSDALCEQKISKFVPTRPEYCHRRVSDTVESEAFFQTIHFIEVIEIWN